MRVNLKKNLIATLVTATVLCTCACQSKGPEEDPKLLQAPDYSKYTDTFETYAYSGPSTGYWSLDGERFYVGESFQTVERFKEYKDCGFDIYLAQSDISVNTELWPTERIKMQNAYEAGLTKIILTDSRIQSLSKVQGGIIGVDDPETAEVEKYQFASEAELDAYVGSCLTLYKDEPGFYGIMLGDEPRHYHATAYGQVYRSLKRVAPDMYIQYNLLPVATAIDANEANNRFPALTEEEDNKNLTFKERIFLRYEKYLNLFLDEMPGIDYLQYDDYPVRPAGLESEFFRGLQIAAKVCKERGLKLNIVAQTFAVRSGGPTGNFYWRQVKEGDARWMNNVLLGMGVEQIHYFTYWTKASNSTTGEYFEDGASFMTRDGLKTEMYHFMQKIMMENDKFAPVIKQFDYQGSRTYAVLPCNLDVTQSVDADNSYTFKKLTNVQFEKEIGLVTELYDAENKNYMYMFMNMLGTWNEGSISYQTNEITFSSEYTHVVIYKNGVGTPQKLEEGNKLTIELAAGEAVFVLPY